MQRIAALQDYYDHSECKDRRAYRRFYRVVLGRKSLKNHPTASALSLEPPTSRNIIMFRERDRDKRKERGYSDAYAVCCPPLGEGIKRQNDRENGRETSLSAQAFAGARQFFRYHCSFSK